MDAERDAEPHVGHGHSHGHSHALVGSWSAWRRNPILRLVLATVAGLAVLTVVGAIAVWPDGAGRQAVIDAGDEVGFVAETVGGVVSQITDASCAFATDDDPATCRTLFVELSDGPDAGDEIALPPLSLEFVQSLPRVAVGDAIVLGYEPTTDTYSYDDRDRRGPMLWLAVLFAVVVVALGRVRGVLALLAMAMTVIVLVAFVAPSVLDGNDPLLVAVVAASGIAFVSLYLTHGFTPTTTVALASTLLALALTLLLSWFFFDLSGFTGLASEEAGLLPLFAADIDLASLLLGGAVLGALGALDDVTVTQVATVAELRAQRPDLDAASLFRSGVRVGREHIASTVNTLLLAYAGASIPLLLLFSASNRSVGLVANSEAVAVEIVRTMCGSIGLVAAVPIATGLTTLVLRDVAADDDAPPAAPPSWDDFAPADDFWR